MNGYGLPEPLGHEVRQSPVRHTQSAEIPVVARRGRVDDAVDVAVKYEATTCPTTESFAYGEVVPTPTLPRTSLPVCARITLPSFPVFVFNPPNKYTEPPL